MGVAGLELYGEAALLRSVAVSPARRGSGVGRALVERALAVLERAGARDVYLLTQSAGGYFPRFGFAPVDRARVPPAVRESLEFREACPESAVVMRRACAQG